MHIYYYTIQLPFTTHALFSISSYFSHLFDTPHLSAVMLES
jgi:hypothetical protein